MIHFMGTSLTLAFDAAAVEILPAINLEVSTPEIQSTSLTQWAIVSLKTALCGFTKLRRRPSSWVCHCLSAFVATMYHNKVLYTHRLVSLSETKNMTMVFLKVGLHSLTLQCSWTETESFLMLMPGSTKYYKVWILATWVSAINSTSLSVNS